MIRYFTPMKDEAHCKSGSYSAPGGDTGDLWGAFHVIRSLSDLRSGGDTGDLWGAFHIPRPRCAAGGDAGDLWGE